MSYYAYDANGYVGDVASGPGWHAFCAWARGQGGRVAELAESGRLVGQKELDGLGAQLAEYVHMDSESDSSIRHNLIALSRQASEVLIITDGEQDE